MVTDEQVRRLRKLSNTEKNQEIAASKAGMDPTTARRYPGLERLPSELKKERAWRTREDPFSEVCAMPQHAHRRRHTDSMLSWLLRCIAFRNFGYDPLLVFSQAPHDCFGFVADRPCEIFWFTLPNCPSCFDAESPCVHRERYRLAEAYVNQRVHIGFANEAHPEAWRGGRFLPNFGSAPEIDIWPKAHTIFGWDMMTSVLIHEFGHCKVYDTSGVCDGSKEVEHKANESGRRNMPPELVPPLYDEHRKFFLRSYETLPEVWDEQRCRSELAAWRKEHS
jgi:hypothetical protein